MCFGCDWWRLPLDAEAGPLPRLGEVLASQPRARVSPSGEITVPRAAVGEVDDVLRLLVRVLVRRADHEAGGGELATTLRKLAGEAGVSLLEA